MNTGNTLAEEKMLSAEDLLMGAEATYKVTVPVEILNPAGTNPENNSMAVQLRPLTVGVFQLIMKASRSDPGLIPLLMLKESLIEPNMTLDQVRRMHLGLVEFLVEHIRQISGLTKKKRN